MHVKTTTGAEVDIPHEEVMRIVETMHQTKDTKHWVEEYHQRAHQNLEKALQTPIGNSEESIKQAMYHHLEWWSEKDVEVVYEMAEWIVSCFYAKLMTEKD